MIHLNIDDIFCGLKESYKILSFLGKGKSGYSYLVGSKNKQYTLKLFHDEANPYYQFQVNKLSAEIEAYNFLEKLEFPVPTLIEYNSEKNYLIKEFIEGEVASKLIASSMITESIICELFRISEICKENGINIDYFPSNFVIEKSGSIFYVDYEINNYQEKWNWENWGIYYWVNNEGFKNFLSSGNADFINSDPVNGIPVKESFENIVKDWISKFSEK